MRLILWGRVFHFLLFSYFWPLKSLRVLKITHIQLRKKSPSRLLLKRGSKMTKKHFFSKNRKIQKKCSFFGYRPLKTANRPRNESRSQKQCILVTFLLESQKVQVRPIYLYIPQAVSPNKARPVQTRNLEHKGQSVKLDQTPTSLWSNKINKICQ